MSESERIAEWADRQTPLNISPVRRPQGRAGHLSHEEKQAIRLEYLEHGGRVTRKALAAKFGVNRDTVAECLKGKEFAQLQKQFEQELREGAIRRLKAHVLPAADAWCESIEVAAQKGDHKPAKDLLMHTGVIDPLDSDGKGRGVLVLMAITLPNGNPGFAAGEGRTYEADLETGCAILPANEHYEQIVQIGGIPHCGISCGQDASPPVKDDRNES